ncbi:hypothetical protein [Metaclostridioides mangenotii]|uniref:hypothetical protein n=1 Tax=Metaclostridioides mangenotii TaxID=1540 RepID=UPI0026E92AD8|nr:hypothetical protein [Clostridioides mangenotii]
MPQFVNDFMSEKLKTLLEDGDNRESNKERSIKENIGATPRNKTKENKNTEYENIPTLTKKELEALNIIKDISKNLFNADDITYIKIGNELNIIYKKDPLKWICKTNLSFPKKSIFLPDNEQGLLQYYMDNVSDIKELEEQVITIIKSYCV